MMWIWPRETMRDADEEDRAFQELRSKIRDAKLLSPAVEVLLAGVRFTGRLSVVVQNGRILKSGYEEGYFTRRQDERVVGRKSWRDGKVAGGRVIVSRSS